jgi:mRNA-degrading endonuclease RelE of RelBE toxin-antitoxin system
MQGCYRLRIGDWRIIYEIANQTLKIYVIMIGQRKDVYRGI